MHLSFLNANWYRQYPFKATATLLGIDGAYMPTDLIVACRLTITSAKMTPYVSKVVTNDGQISIEFSNGTISLGTINAVITEDNQQVVIQSQVPDFSGSVTIGNADRVNESASYSFDSSTGALEPSVITQFTAPSISKLTHNTISLTGVVTFNPTNLALLVVGQEIQLSVLFPQEIASRQDKTAALLTCTNPVIAGINTVNPIPVPSVGNDIDIFGIEPVTITAIGGKITIGTTGIAITDVCNKVNIPPTNTTNTYLTDIATTDTAEWSNWPQYNP